MVGTNGWSLPPGSTLMRVPTITTVSSIQPRALLFLLLLSAVIVLSLTAVIERPHDTHGVSASSDDHAPGQPDDHGAPAAVATDAEHADASDSSHATDVPGAEEAHATEGIHGTVEVGGAEDAHMTEEVHGTEDAHATEEVHGTEEAHVAEAARDEHPPGTPTAPSTGEHDSSSSSSMLGVNLESLNLVSPRLIVVVVGLTLLAALACAVRLSAGLLAVIIGLSLIGLAASGREALHAGEELGIFVPLPILAAVLYAGAGALAGLQIVTLGTRTASPHDAHG
jgi:hypothetical protein